MSEPESLDLVWGAAAIAAFIGRTPRQAWEALNKGALPARQINGRWCASKRRLTAFFEGMEVSEAQGASMTPAAAPVAAQPATGRAGRSSAVVHKLTPRKGRAA